jgi:hypothetical protein
LRKELFASGNGKYPLRCGPYRLCYISLVS